MTVVLAKSIRKWSTSTIGVALTRATLREKPLGSSN